MKFKAFPITLYLTFCLFSIGLSQQSDLPQTLSIENITFLNKLQLKPLPSIKAEVQRVWMQNQVLELITTDQGIKGSLTTFLIAKPSNYQTKTDTFINKEKLNAIDIATAISILSEINLNDTNNLEKITNKTNPKYIYIIENRNNNSKISRYYFPQSRNKSTKLTFTELKFKELRKELSLSKKRYLFMKRFPKRGFYSDGTRDMDCNCKNKLTLGYRASTNLPIGLQAITYLGDIDKAHINLGASVNYSTNKLNDRDLRISITKYDLFNNKFNSLSRSLNYTYRYRQFSFTDFNGISQNNKFIYNLTAFNRFTIGAGVDFLSQKERERGIILDAKTKSKRNTLQTTFRASIFQDHIDYRMGITKAFKIINKSKIRIGINYERFYEFSDFYFNASYQF